MSSPKYNRESSIGSDNDRQKFDSSSTPMTVHGSPKMTKIDKEMYSSYQATGILKNKLW